MEQEKVVCEGSNVWRGALELRLGGSAHPHVSRPRRPTALRSRRMLAA